MIFVDLNWQPFIRVVSKGTHPFGQGAFGHNYHGGLKTITTMVLVKDNNYHANSEAQICYLAHYEFLTQNAAHPNQTGSQTT